jgi:hypothetical protein
VIPRPRKLLAAAPLLAAALAGCGTTAAPASRTAAMAAPIREPMVTRPLVLSEAAPAAAPAPGLMNATPVAAVVVAQPAPVVAATPLCDSNGRPLSGNIKTKASPRECTAEEIQTAAVTPGTE